MGYTIDGCLDLVHQQCVSKWWDFYQKFRAQTDNQNQKKTTEKTWEITTEIDIFWRVKVQFGGLDYRKCFATFRTSHPGWLLHGECHCFNAILCTNDRFKKLAKCLWHLQWVGFLTKDFLQSLGDSFHRKMGRYQFFFRDIRMDMDHHYPHNHVTLYLRPIDLWEMTDKSPWCGWHVSVDDCYSQHPSWILTERSSQIKFRKNGMKKKNSSSCAIVLCFFFSICKGS